MHDAALDDIEVGPPPVRRAIVGLVLGLAAGAVAVVLLDRDPAEGMRSA